MNPSNGLPSVFDLNSLQALKSQVKSSDPEALRSAAKQFEALFLQMVLKSMRDTLPKDGLFDNDQSRMYESLLDQQLSQVMSGSGRGLGLAAVIERQLNPQPALNEFPDGLPMIPPPRSYEVAPPTRPFDLKPSSQPLRPLTGAAAIQAAQPVNEVAADFVSRMTPYALAAQRKSGIPAQFMVAQAALETGWGRSEPRFADGRTSFNLFGIKADRSWQGNSVEVSTQEYVNGQAQRQMESFRAYGSYSEAFADYARLLSTNPRYAAAASSQDPARFAQALQQAGYATDPQYAAKLEKIMASPALKPLNTA